MPIDRRTFVLGSGVAAASGTLATFSAAIDARTVLAADAMTAPLAEGLPLQALRIVGWEGNVDLAPATSAVAGESHWIAIDRQWRGAWH